MSQVGSASRKAVDGQIAKGLVAQAVDGVKRGRRNAHHIAWIEQAFLAVFTDDQAALASQDIKDLLHIGVLVGRWLDRTFETGIFFSGSLIFLGVTFGCYLAWQRVNRESAG